MQAVLQHATSVGVLETMTAQAIALTMLGYGLFGYCREEGAMEVLLGHACAKV